jgi:hypothetical protein
MVPEIIVTNSGRDLIVFGGENSPGLPKAVTTTLFDLWEQCYYLASEPHTISKGNNITFELCIVSTTPIAIHRLSTSLTVRLEIDRTSLRKGF